MLLKHFDMLVKYFLICYIIFKKTLLDDKSGQLSVLTKHQELVFLMYLSLAARSI
jgi:hypothetical protein